MGFSFSTIEPNQIGQVSKFDIPFNQWVGLKFTEGHSFTFGNSISEATEEQIWDDDNPVRPDVLNRIYGIDSRLKFDSPMSIQRARLIHERKRRELERLSYLESASHSWFSAKAAAGFGASLVGGLSHPLDLGLAFLPFIGSEKAAAQISGIGGGAAFRRSLARGLITTEERLAAKGVPFSSLTARIIDGTLSQAIVEIPVAIQKHRNMADYTLTDSVFNVVAGGAFAGALKGLGLALERAANLWKAADPRVREAALMDTAASIINENHQPQAHWAMGLDEATIRAKTEERIRREQPFVQQPQNGTFQERFPVGSEVEFTPPGSISGKQIESGTVIGYRRDPTTGEWFAEVMSQSGNLKEFAGDINNIRLKEISPARVDVDDADAIDRELANQETRRQSIADFNAKAKADYEAKIKNQVDAETKRVMDEVRKQTQPLPPDVAKKHSIPRVPEDSHISAIEEEIADIEADIMAQARTPEDVARLKERLKRAQAEAEELSGEKAMDKMLPCVAKRAE